MKHSKLSLVKSGKEDLKLREYQEKGANFGLTNPLAILAVSTNYGKTVVAIWIIMEYLKTKPKAKILILTHGTNVLKDNFMEKLKDYVDPLKFSASFKPSARIHVAIPQDSRIKTQNHYDFIIVDEGQEFYLVEEGMVKKIITKFNPTKQLILTGSPERFIRAGGYQDNMYFFAMNQIPDQYRSNFTYELRFLQYVEDLGLLSEVTRGPEIAYVDHDGKKRTYFCDYQIKSSTFEIKSSYIWNKALKTNLLKKEAAEKLYDYHIIIDNKFSKLKKLLCQKKNTKTGYV